MIEDDNEDCEDYEDHEREDGPLDEAGTENTVDDSMDEHIDKVDDTVAAENNCK